MILRQIGVRHGMYPKPVASVFGDPVLMTIAGRQLLFKPRLQSLRRGAHTEVEATRDDQSNGLQEQIEPQRQIPTTVGGPHSAVAPPDTTSKLYHIFQRHSPSTPATTFSTPADILYQKKQRNPSELKSYPITNPQES